MKTSKRFNKRSGLRFWMAIALVPVVFGCAGRTAAPGGETSKETSAQRSGSTCAKDLSLTGKPHSEAEDCDCNKSPQATIPTMRYIASVEGDYQSDYEPDRKLAEERMKQWEGKAPEPTDVPKYLEYLSVLDASGRGGEAEGKLKKFLAKNPSEKRALFLLGVHYMRSHKRDLANYFFTQLEKDNSFAYKSLLFNNLGMLALQDNNRAVALEYFEKATKAEPATAAPFVNLGALYLKSRSYADAERVFGKAHELDEDFEDAVLGLGGAMEGQGKFEEAHKLYTEFIASHPNALSVLYNEAVILGNRLKQREQAAQLMLRYIQRGGKESAKAHEVIQNWK